MMRIYTVFYGPLPSKPNKVSFGVDHAGTLTEEPPTIEELQTLREDARVAGRWFPDAISGIKYAGLLAYCVGQTLGAGSKTYRVTVSEVTDPVEGENATTTPVASLDFEFEQFTESSRYDFIPDAVCGFQGRVAGTLAVRPYRWGHFSNALAAAAGGTKLLTRADWPDVTDIALISCYDLAFLIFDTGLDAISEAQDVDSDVTTVSLQTKLSFRVRRA